MRGLDALSEPAWGWHEIYVLGGFLIAALLFYVGWKEHKASR